jgi:hypothetical protein
MTATASPAGHARRCLSTASRLLPVTDPETVSATVTRSDESWEQEALPRGVRIAFAGAIVGLIVGCVIGFVATSGGDLLRVGTIIGLGLVGMIAGAVICLAVLGVWRLFRP